MFGPKARCLVGEHVADSSPEFSGVKAFRVGAVAMGLNPCEEVRLAYSLAHGGTELISANAKRGKQIGASALHVVRADRASRQQRACFVDRSRKKAVTGELFACAPRRRKSEIERCHKIGCYGACFSCNHTALPSGSRSIAIAQLYGVLCGSVDSTPRLLRMVR